MKVEQTATGVEGHEPAGERIWRDGRSIASLRYRLSFQICPYFYGVNPSV